MNSAEPVTSPRPKRRAHTRRDLGLIALGSRIPAKLQRRTMFWVNKTSQRLLARAQEALAPLGLEPREYVVLLLLEEAGPLPQREVGAALNLDANLVVVLLDRLETSGLVRRQVNSQDRRAHAVRLMPAGARVIAEASAVLDAMEHRLFGALSRQERETLAALLKRLHA